MAKVLVPLANGFEDVEAIAVIDVLRRGGVEVVTASIHDTNAVRSAHGVHLEADARFADVGDASYDAVILPGGGEGVANLKSCEALIRRLRRQNEEGRLLCAICAAPLVLVKAEVLGSKTVVTCYPSCQKDLDRDWSPASVVADGNVITGQAPGSALLFALVVLQALAGEHVARQVAHDLVSDVLN